MYLIKYIKKVTRKPEVAETQHQTIFPALFILGTVELVNYHFELN